MRFLKTAAICLLLALWFLPAAHAEENPGASFYLWRLINEARVRPLQTLALFGIEEQAAREALQAIGRTPDQGLPPLAWNQNLSDAALAHNRDMSANLYYASEAPDGTTVAARTAAAGYEAASTGESLGALIFDTYLEPMQAADIIFGNMLRDELFGGASGAGKIFSLDFTEIGIAFAAARLDLGEGRATNAYVAVADFGQPLTPRSFVAGNAYRDSGSGSFVPLEAASGATMVLRLMAQNIDRSMPVGPLGAYQFELVPDFLQLELRDAAGQVLARRSVIRRASTQLVDLLIDE